MRGRTQTITTDSGPAAAAPPVPSCIGKYRILEPIGEGGFGIVYKGFDPFIKRHVAIKTCTSPDSELRQRYFREAEIAGRLDHPNIVRIFDFGVEVETPYLVQEFLSGSDLDERMAARDFIPYPERLLYLIHVARGLGYAHSQGVIHRDVKPANVRVLEDGSVKIMDFGVAMLLNTETRLTRDGMAVGTAAYLAPEQVRGEPTSPCTDVFSFGVLAYELLTGHRPFERDTISATLFSIVNDEPKSISLPAHACPPKLRQLIDRCLQKQPEQRFAGFDEIVEVLDRIRSETRSGARERDYDAELREVTIAPAADSALPPEVQATEFDPQLDHGGRASSPRRRRRYRWLAAILLLTSMGLGFGVLAIRSRAPWPWAPTQMQPESERAPHPPPSEALTPAADRGLAAASNRQRPEDTGLPAVAAVEPIETSAIAESTPEESQGPASIEEPSTEAMTGESQAATAELAPPPVAKATLVLAPGWHPKVTARIDDGPVLALTRQRSRKLEPGRYTVRYALDLADYRDIRTLNIELAPGETRALPTPLARPGFLSIQASLGSPQGIVHIDGKPVGSSPVRALRLPAGGHHVQVFAVDHPTVPLADRSVEVESNHETVVTFDLTGQRDLAIRLRADPPPRRRR